MNDENPLPGLIPDAEIPSMPSSGGNEVTSGPALPAGGLGANIASSLANALAASAGYVTRDPQLEQSALQREQRNQQMLQMAPMRAGLAAALDLDARGDATGAMQALRDHPATLLSPQGLAIYQNITNRQRAIAQHTAAVSALEGKGDVTGGLAAAYLRADPTMSTKDAVGLAISTLGQNKVEKADDGFHILNPGTGQELAFIPTKRVLTTKPGETLTEVGGGPAGQPTVTQNLYTAPQSQYAKDAPTGVREQLDGPGYDRLREQEARGNSAAGEAADALYRQAQARHLASSNPAEMKVALAQAGVDPVAFAQGDLSKESGDAVARVMDARKSALMVQNADAVTRAHLAVQPDPRSFIKRDGSTELVSGLSKTDAATAVAAGDIFPLTPDNQKQLGVIATLKSEIQGAREIALKLYADPQVTGLTLERALTLGIQRHLVSGDEARVLKGELAALSINLTRAITGSSRPGQQTQEQVRLHVLPGDNESLTSVMGKLREADMLVENRVDAIAGKTPRWTSTNPFGASDIQRLKNGERPIGVNSDGTFTFSPPMISPGGIRIRQR